MPGKHDRRKRNRYPTYVPPEPTLDIQIEDGVGFTVEEIEALVRPEAAQLALLAPNLTFKVQTQYPSSTATSAGTGRLPDGSIGYTTFRATIYLDARSTAGFLVKPEYTVSHEYGHAWTLYHLTLTHQQDWSPWLDIRGLTGNPLLDSSYRWMKNEMIADDYRLLFGSEVAKSQGNYINRDVADPRTIEGLKSWFISEWAKS